MSESLLNEIRAAKPVAPSALRDRVRALSAEEPAREPFLARFRWRQLVLVAPVTLVLALSAATVIGLTRDDALRGRRPRSPPQATAATTRRRRRSKRPATRRASAQGDWRFAPPQPTRAGAVPPAAGQLQRYEAELRLRVDDVEALSGATKSAQRIALSHGGSIASLQYEAPSEGIGSAQITLRVPISKVQSAMTQLSGARHDRRPALRDRGSPGAGRQPRVADRGDAAADRGDPRPAREHDPFRREPRRAEVAARERPRQAEGPARRARRHARRGEDGHDLPLADDREDRARRRRAAARSTTSRTCSRGRRSGSSTSLVVAGPFILVGFLVWLALRLRRRQVNTRLLEQN